MKFTILAFYVAMCTTLAVAAQSNAANIFRDPQYNLDRNHHPLKISAAKAVS
jgi:hypothetical protein